MTEKKDCREGNPATAGVHAPDREAMSSGLEARRPGSPAGSAATTATTNAATSSATTTSTATTAAATTTTTAALRR
jgi:hypothetical protein